MGKIITVASHKGGVGKTTTVLNLGFSLSRIGQKVLLVDADPQGAMAIASNLKKKTDKGLAHLLKQQVQKKEILFYTKDRSMGVVGMGEIGPEDVMTFERFARQRTLGRAIQDLSEDFDYTFVDAPAGLGTITTGLLIDSDSVLVPINCRAIAVRTLPAFLKLVQRIRAKMNQRLRLEGILVNMVTAEATAKTVLEEITESFPPSVLFETLIPYDDAVEMASLGAKPVGMLAGGETVADAFVTLALELKKREFIDQTRGLSNDDDEGLF